MARVYSLRLLPACSSENSPPQNSEQLPKPLLRTCYHTVMKKLLQLFWTNFTISLCTFGGGYVIAGFMKERFVRGLHWIDDEEMLDMIAMAQAAPGAIAVNTSVLVGWKVAGLPGMLVSVLGTVLPPMLVLLVISVFYSAFVSSRIIRLLLRGMQAGVVAVILDAVLDLVLPNRSQALYLVLFAAALALSLSGINVMAIVLGAIVLGILLTWRRLHVS